MRRGTSSRIKQNHRSLTEDEKSIRSITHTTILLDFSRRIVLLKASRRFGLFYLFRNNKSCCSEACLGLMLQNISSASQFRYIKLKLVITKLTHCTGFWGNASFRRLFKLLSTIKTNKLKIISLVFWNIMGIFNSRFAVIQ